MTRRRDEPAGRSLRRHRERLAFTQEEVAQALSALAWERDRLRVGVNASMVSKWERGSKRPSKLYRALLCQLYGTTEEDVGFRRRVTSAGLGQGPAKGLIGDDDMNRRELLRHAAKLGAAVVVPVDWLSRSGYAPDVVDLPALRASVSAAWSAFQNSQYQVLESRLPGIVATAQTALRDADDDQRPHSFALLAEAYRVLASLLLKQGDLHVALVAADRCVVAAKQSEDECVAAGAARCLTHALMAVSRDREALDVAVTAAGAVDPGLHAASPDQLSVYGALLLKAAMVAARQGNPDEAKWLLDEAEIAASRLGRDDNYCWTAFGPTNVLVHRVSAAVELGEGGAAVAQARQVRSLDLPVTERRAHLLIDTARGYGQWGKDDQALEMLLQAEHLAADEVRCQAAARALVRELLTTDRRGSSELRSLAGRLQVAA